MVISRSLFSAFGANRSAILPWLNFNLKTGFVAVLNHCAFAVHERAVLLKLIENSLYMHPVLSFACLVVANKASQRLLQDASFSYSAIERRFQDVIYDGFLPTDSSEEPKFEA